MIKALYKDSTSSVILIIYNIIASNHLIGVRHVCLMSSIIFNVFLEDIMSDIHNNHESTILIGGRPISNLRFAYYIYLIAGSSGLQ